MEPTLRVQEGDISISGYGGTPTQEEPSVSGSPLPSSVNPQQRSSEAVSWVTENPVKSAIRTDHHRVPGVFLPVQ